MVVLTSAATATAQPTVIKTKDAPTPATAFAVDRRGDFYLASASGTLSKYDSGGNEVVNWSPSRLGRITLIDAWNPLKVFVFYREFQSAVILDRFLRPTAQYDLADASIGFVRLACPSQDNSFWLVDDSYNGLLKYDPLEQQVSSRIPFNASIPVDGNIVFMREYQNVLFVLLSTGTVLHFDNLGSYQSSMASPVRGWAGFDKNRIYGLATGGLWTANLYDSSSEIIKLDRGYQACLWLHDRLVGIKEEGGFHLLRID